MGSQTQFLQPESEIREEEISEKEAGNLDKGVVASIYCVRRSEDANSLIISA